MVATSVAKTNIHGGLENSIMKFVMKAVAPFDFDLSAGIYSDGDGQIRRYENWRYWQVVRVGAKLFLVTIKASGTVDEPRLIVDLRSDREISSKDKEAVRGIIVSIFNLNLNLKPFYETVAKDRVMSKLVQKLRGLKGPTTETIFEALIDSIIEQQISLIVASNLERKLIKKFGDALRLGDEVYYAFPTPERLASATVEQLRGSSLTLRKAEYIRDVSTLIEDGKLDLDKLKNYEDASQITNELCKIRGVGVWTAELTMVRGMGKPGVIPADDVGLRRVISHYYCGGRRISPEEARRVAENWGKWKGSAAFYLIMAERLGVED